MRTTPKVRRATGIVFATVVATSLAACGGGSPGSSSSGSASTAVTQIGFWDPYPQYDDSSDWAKYVQACAPSGATIKRTTAPNTDLINNLTTAVREDNAPDVVFLDNPAVPEASASGLLASLDTVGIPPGDADANLAGPGTVDGKTYGVPIGANTLGLYYNEDILKKAGVDTVDDHGLGQPQRRAREGHQGRRQGHHLRRRPRRGGYLPVPAVVLGCGGEPEGHRLGAGRAGRAARLRLGGQGVRPEVGHHRQPVGVLGPVPHRGSTPSPRTAPGSPRPPPRRSSRSR